MAAVKRWQNQEEALQFVLSHSAVMLNMDMGTGKTRVAIDACFLRKGKVKKVLVVCPKSVIPVWRRNLSKFYDDGWVCWDTTTGTIKSKAESISAFVEEWASKEEQPKIFVVVNYDIVWKAPMGDTLRRIYFDMVILDESHRAKSAGSKVSKYLALLGKYAPYRLCLSGTPMANSPLDVYGQYRFLDPTIFGTRYDLFRDEYAILGGPEHNFIVGYKNQRRLNVKFQSIAYTCKMTDIMDRLKMPDKLPPSIVEVELPSKDTKTIKALRKDFIAECGPQEFVVLRNVLSLSLREQQITSGFVISQPGPLEETTITELNSVKSEAFRDYIDSLDVKESLVVFYVFKHDASVLRSVCDSMSRPVFELSGDVNELSTWQEYGGILIAQIQSGAEGVDMTRANRGLYFSLPQSLALYEQSMARLYRPGQTKDVQFGYILAKGTIDEKIFKCLTNKKSLIEGIQSGFIDMDYLKR